VKLPSLVDVGGRIRRTKSLFLLNPNRDNEDNEEDDDDSNDSVSGDNDSKGKDDKDINFDLETARTQLESLLGSDGESEGEGEGTNDNNDSSDQRNGELTLKSLIASKEMILPPPTPKILSTIDRRRRLTEIKLLKCFTQNVRGDNVEEDQKTIACLWDHWYSERGQEAKSELEKTDILLGSEDRWNECEIELVTLIDHYGLYFVEPVNRLATLFYLQGRYIESYRLCRVVLTIKPWHFGAVSGIVQVCLAMGNKKNAIYWADRRLPRVESGDNSYIPLQRMEWVMNAVTDAKRLLGTAQRKTRNSFGQPEDYYTDDKSSSSSSDSENSQERLLNYDDDNTEDDAWQ